MSAVWIGDPARPIVTRHVLATPESTGLSREGQALRLPEISTTAHVGWPLVRGGSISTRRIALRNPITSSLVVVRCAASGVTNTAALVFTPRAAVAAAPAAVSTAVTTVVMTMR